MMSCEDTPKEFLSADECRALFARVMGMVSGGGETTMSIKNEWSGTAKWARNRMQVASDTHTVEIMIQRSIRGAYATSNTTRLDDDGLRQAVVDVELSLQTRQEQAEQITNPFVDTPMLEPVLWSESTYGYGAGARLELAQELIMGAEDAGLLSAGELRIAANGTATLSSAGLFRYYAQTAVECSMTVRDAKGTLSGWAGVNHYDLGKIDPRALAARALSKAQRSARPVAVEPGRYTAILEPQATADLLFPLVERSLDRQRAEDPSGPFGGKQSGYSRITEQVLDRRLMLTADPMSQDGGFIPFDWTTGTPYQSVRWVDQGILKELSYNKWYALAALNKGVALANSLSFTLSALPGVPPSTVEEMIAKTERGILVTRLSNVQMVDGRSALCTGYTRDGLWLIEHGKISKSIKNFRFTESPLFALNNLEDVGVPQRVFSPQRAQVAPAVRVRDFSFTGNADAV